MGVWVFGCLSGNTGLRPYYALMIKLILLKCACTYKIQCMHMYQTYMIDQSWRQGKGGQLHLKTGLLFLEKK